MRHTFTVRLSCELLVQLLTEGWTSGERRIDLVANGLPPGCRMRSVRLEGSYVVAVFELGGGDARTPVDHVQLMPRYSQTRLAP